MELIDLLRPLARALPSLTFTLVTLCLDNSSIESYRLSGQKVQNWAMPEKRLEVCWQRARKRFELEDDEVYEDPEAERWAEEQMLVEALNHWDSRIAQKAAQLRTVSATGAMESIFTDHAASIDSFVDGLQPVSGQVGAAFAIDGRIVGFDLFDSETTLRKLLPKLVRSAAVEALEGDSGQASLAGMDCA